MNSQSHSEHIIFFLKLGRKLPKTYFHLAANLNLMGITLIPTTYSELNRIMHDHKNRLHKVNVVLMTWNFESHQKFQEIKEMFKLGLLQQKLQVFHLSSFAPEWNEHIGVKKIKNYLYLALPLSLRSIAYTIGPQYLQSLHQAQIWPGGRRAKLPLI